MIIELKTDNSTAGIETKGAELKSLVIDNREIMWCADPAYWGKTSPVLFPAIGNVRNNETIIDGQKVKLIKHGFARDNEFKVIKQLESSVVLSFTYLPKAGMYPFPCTLSLCYALYRDKLTVTYSVYNNHPKKDMPFCIGAHPAIACNNLDNCRLLFQCKERASTPVMNLETRLFESKNRINRIGGGSKLKLSYDMFDNDVVYFDKLKSRSVTLTEGKQTLATISFEGFNTLGLWTPAGKRAGFICIEPWCGSDDYDNDSGIFEEKKDIQTVPPKKLRNYTMTISAN